MSNKYSNLKIFHYTEKLDSLSQKNDQIQPPIHIRIKPTNVCNHSCWYCSYQSLDDIQLGKDMVLKDMIPKDKMMQIIDDCMEMNVEAITFSGGGEPFMYPHFLDVVKKLSKSNIKFSSLTNGSKLKGELAEIFAKNAQWIRISIDGWDDKSYAQYRSIKEGEFSKIIQNMKDFTTIPNRICNLGVSFIIDKENYQHIYSFVKLMKDIGVDSIKLAPCIVDNDGAKNNIYHNEFYKLAKELCIKTKEELEDENFEIFDSYHLLSEKFDKNYSWCPYTQINPVIGADMRVYTCHDKAYNLETGSLGTIKDIDFKELWMNNKAKFFNVNPQKDCHHHCAVNEKNKMILDYLNIDTDHIGFV